MRFEIYLPVHFRSTLYLSIAQIGHAFGLPHTDERFFNQELGNCMDYTFNYEVNQSPDTSNFELLEVLYGEIGALSSQRPSRAPSQSLMPSQVLMSSPSQQPKTMQPISTPTPPPKRSKQRGSKDGRRRQNPALAKNDGGNTATEERLFPWELRDG